MEKIGKIHAGEETSVRYEAIGLDAHRDRCIWVVGGEITTRGQDAISQGSTREGEPGGCVWIGYSEFSHHCGNWLSSLWKAVVFASDTRA